MTQENPTAPLKPTPQQLTAAQKYEGRLVDSIHHAIVVEPTLHANRLPENIFRDYFLPAFAGSVPLGKHYEEWISIAGAPTAEVAIVDASGSNILFNVPALMNTDHIKRTRPEGALPFASIVTMAEAFRTRSAAASQNVMTAQGMDRYKASHDSSHDYTPIEKRWLEIFQRYGYVPVQTGAAAAVEKKDTGSVSDDEFVEN